LLSASLPKRENNLSVEAATTLLIELELQTLHSKRVFVSPQISGGEIWKHGIAGKFV
jgi:hypothetical protein